MNETTVTFQTLPTSLAQLQTLPGADLKDPYQTAALTVAALCAYPADKEAAFAMLNYLKGPEPLSTYEKQFLADRFRDADYVPRSYFRGAVPANNYTPDQPYSITVFENAHSRDSISQGYLTVFLTSGGADSPRQIRLRTKPSTGQWFLNEQMLLSGIRIPAAADPWA